jgi:hypothetical protein
MFEECTICWNIGGDPYVVHQHMELRERTLTGADDSPKHVQLRNQRLYFGVKDASIRPSDQTCPESLQDIVHIECFFHCIILIAGALIQPSIWTAQLASMLQYQCLYFVDGIAP